MGFFVSNNMIDPLLENVNFNQNIDPAELQKTLLGFLGQTYSEISRYDNNLVSTNQFLAPKKHEFQRTAEQVLREVSGTQPQQINPVPSNQYELDPRPYIDYKNQASPPSPYDPNQMEFNFDNSVTAKSIDVKLNNIEKSIKKLDTMLQKMVSYIESHDNKNIKQE
jgi:hypothetical protein